jgi:YD repeat-containing protein
LQDRGTVSGYFNRPPRQSTFLTYVNESTTPTTWEVTSSRTYWGNGLATSQRYTGSDSYGWDGLGHFKVSVASGNIASTDGSTAESRISFTNHTSAIDASHYLLNIPTEHCTSATVPGDPSTLGSCSSLAQPLTTRMNWDTSTGFLLGKRTLASGSAENPWDLLSVFTYDDHDNLASESFWGGDDTSVQNAGTGFSPVNTAQYHITYSSTYAASGALTNVQADYPVSPGFHVKDIDYDPSTGFVSKSRDVSGLETQYAYDNAGRLTSVTPPGTTAVPAVGAATNYTYTNASTSGSSFTPAGVVAVTGGDPLIRVQKDYTYDGLGRLWRSTDHLPAGASTREVIYDALGRAVKQSELETTPTNYTTTHYDSVGRPDTITSPDGHVATVEYPDGPRTTRRTVMVKTLDQSSGNETAATSVETYDSFGRLVSAEDPVHTIASYQYDSADRLINVSVASGPAQVRTFNYDGRGFLLSESHPELGFTTFHYTYDSRGHVLMKNVFINNQPRMDLIFNLRYTYDAAERLSELDSVNPYYNPNSNPPTSQWRPTKLFTFGANATGDYAQGKMKPPSVITTVRSSATCG